MIAAVTSEIVAARRAGDRVSVAVGFAQVRVLMAIVAAGAPIDDLPAEVIAAVARILASVGVGQ